MAGKTRVLTFSEGVEVSAPVQSFLTTSSFEVFASEADYVTAKGSPAADGDTFYDSTTDTRKLYANGSWGSSLESSNSDVSLNSAAQTVSAIKTHTAVIDITNTTQSTSDDSGALVIDGGLGVKKDVFISGNLNVTGTSASLDDLLVTDETITVNNGGTEATADAGNAGIIVSKSDATNSAIEFDSTATSKFKAGDVGSTVEIADISSTQNISNKLIIDPARLDTKKDTKANLDTYALTASNGQLCFATDEKLMYQVIDSALESVGGGAGGGLDIFHIQEFEALGVSGFLETGNNASFSGGGTIDGALSNDTSTQIAGDQSIKYTAGAASQNDYVEIESITLERKQTDSDQGGREIKKTIWVDMTNFSTDVEIVIYDVTNAAKLNSSLDLLEGGVGLSKYEVVVFVPDTATTITYGLHMLVAPVNTESLVFDDVEFTNDVFCKKETTETAAVTFTGWTGIDGSSRVTLPTLLTDDGGSLISPDNTGAFTKIVFSESCYFTASATMQNDSGSGDGFVRIAQLDSLGAGIINGFSNTNASTEFGMTASITGKASPGDWIEVKSAAGIANSVETNLSVTASSSSLSNIVALNGNANDIVVDGSGNAGTALTANTTDIDWIEVSDTHSAWSGSQFTVPYSGIYSLDGTVTFNGDIGSSIDLYVDGTKDRKIATSGTGNQQNYPFSKTLHFNKGEVVSIRAVSSSTLLNSVNHTLSITKQGVISQAAIPVERVCYIKETQPSGTQGGSFTSGAWQTRTLNTLSGDTTFASLASNRITLSPGLYQFKGEPNAFKVSAHQGKLVGDPAGTPFDALIGESAHAQSSDNTQTTSLIEGELLITKAQSYEIQHQCSTTAATNGFGAAGAFGVVETYTQVVIRKLR